MLTILNKNSERLAEVADKDFNGRCLHRAQVAGLDLEGSRLDETDLAGADLSEADHYWASFYEAICEGCN